MSRLISQILLAILLFPLAGLLYFVTVVVAWEWQGGWSRTSINASFVVAGVVTWAFIAAYWLLLWRKHVRWTGSRASGTMLCALAAAVGGVVVGGVVQLVEDEVGFFVGTAVAPLLWQAGTILIWRETAAERAERLAGATNGIVCPTCGYNLTGLKGTRCPECGSEFTLDRLLAEQPAKAQQELEV